MPTDPSSGPRDRQSAPSETTADAGGPRGVVLVADDDAEFAETVDMWLTPAWTVTVVNDGRDAVDAYGPHVDVVLLDRRMPVMSGDEALSAIRERDGDARVAMMTAVDPDWDVAEMAFDTYLQKPVSRTEVVGVVEELCERATYAREVQALFSLSEKIGLLRSRYSADELANDERYQRLTTEFDRVNRQARRQLDDIDDEALTGLVRVDDA